jgi:excisionase family DNA binding protein
MKGGDFMDLKDLPLVLKVEQVAEILGVSKRRAYEIMDLKTFPLLKVGRSKRVSRDAFFQWLEGQKVS